MPLKQPSPSNSDYYPLPSQRTTQKPKSQQGKQPKQRIHPINQVEGIDEEDEHQRQENLGPHRIQLPHAKQPHEIHRTLREIKDMHR